MSKSTVAVKLANKMHKSEVGLFSVFVDLPNGNRGMIKCEIKDTDIPTGNPAPIRITEASYVVDVPELMMIFTGME
jgi:hypothetical protein